MIGTLVNPKFVFLAALLVVAVYLFSFSNVPEFQEISFPQAIVVTDEWFEHPVSDEELERIIALSYQVDVFVRSNHVAEHSTSSAAMRCLNQRGNVAAFSEFGSWRLHLICWSPKENILYDIVINRINKWVDKWSNPYSDLITAYAPEGVQGANMLEKVSFYLKHLELTKGGKIVNLIFAAGEIMFIPK